MHQTYTASHSPGIELKTTLSSRWPWIMLFSRLVLFVVIQVLFASGFLLFGSTNVWQESANWWTFVVTVANFVCMFLLIQLFRAEGKHYWDIFHIQREHIKADLLALLVVLLITGPVAFLPNIMLGKWLFGDPQTTLDLLVRPLPLWAAYASIILFPVTQGLAELGTYFGYVMPRFKAQGMSLWIAITLPALLLGLQHLALPLLFDVRFIIWRGLMFIPFAFLVGIVMHWRPRLFPYLAIVHVLMDMSFAVMFLSMAY